MLSSSRQIKKLTIRSDHDNEGLDAVANLMLSRFPDSIQRLLEILPSRCGS